MLPIAPRASIERAAECQTVLAALGASSGQLGRDECGDWRVDGRAGHVYPDGAGILLVVFAGSKRAWASVKARLDFCQLTQDGDDEGSLRLDRLPTPAEAVEIRQVLRLRKRRHDDPATLARLRGSPDIRGVSGSPIAQIGTPAPECRPAPAATGRAAP